MLQQSCWKDSSSDQGTHFHLSIPSPLFAQFTLYALQTFKCKQCYKLFYQKNRLREDFLLYQVTKDLKGWTLLSAPPTNNTNTHSTMYNVHILLHI